MTKVIDIKTRKIIKSPSAVDNAYLQNVAKNNLAKAVNQQNNIRIHLSKVLIEEINYTLKNLAVKDPLVNRILLKISPESAIILRDGLFKDLKAEYQTKGIYLDYQYVPNDGINYYGLLWIYWDLNYKKWHNRIFRSISLNPLKITALFTLGLILLYFSMRT